MNVDLLIEPLQLLLRNAGEFLPRLALAMLVLVAGWLFAKAVRFAVVRGLRAINFNVLTERAGMGLRPGRPSGRFSSGKYSRIRSH